MSTEINFVDYSRVQEAFESVRGDGETNKVVVVAHVDNKPDLVDLVHVGPSFSELSSILDPSQVMYVLARFDVQFDMSATVKFVYIHWMGSKVPYGVRGRCGVVHESVRNNFDPYHLAMEIDSIDDIDEEYIMSKLEDNTGKRSHILESQEVVGRQERGFTANQIKNKSISTTKVNSPVTKGATIKFDDSVQESLQDVRDDNTPTNWMLVSYEDGDPKKPIVVVGSGNGGITELKEMLVDDQALYGLYRTTDIVDDISTVKFIYIIWLGDNVKPMTKAKVSTHKGSLEDMFYPTHVTIFASDASDISENIVMDKVKSASGTKSHVK